MEDRSAKILLDVPVEDGVLGFDNYRDALNSIIGSSDPHFTIGIFGGWGTGKTTLMKMMKKQLDDEAEVTVWFNPWQYEKEEHLIIPLLQTVELELKDQKVAKSETIEKLGKTVLVLLSGLSAELPVVGVGISPKDAIDTYQKLFESKNLSSIYFKLHQQLSEIINELKEKQKERIVIFIDDLDRCLPDKALQVLESIKGFLDMDGYVFVLGLSREIIEKCVDAKYGKGSGISGSQYLRKMIQVPFTLPDLRKQEIADYVEKLKQEIKGSEVEKHVSDYFDIIMEGMEPNPREIKRFINNFILANRISQKETDPDKLLALLIIQFRWEGFYRDLARYKEEFLQQTGVIVKSKEALQNEESRKTAKESWEFFDMIEGHLKDEQLKTFLEGAGSVLFEIQDLDPYIHFSKSVALEKEETEGKRSKGELIHLLSHMRIEEFNTVRPYPNVDLRRVHLASATLSGANLSGADLRGAYLRGADLGKAILRDANLSGANMREAFLGWVDFSGADLTSSDLSGADLGGSNISYVNLIAANLTKADLTKTQVDNIVVDDDTTFDETTIPSVNAFTNRVRAKIRIERKHGILKATSKRLWEERKSQGKT